MATIKDVAKLADVSPSTVSRVIAGSNRISLETKLRVKRAMEELNYVPNAIARSLARSRSRTIGFTIAREADQAFSNPFFSEVMRGMSTIAQARDYNILLSISRTPEEERQKCMQLFRERRVDGLIVSTSRKQDPLIDLLIAENVPFALIGRSCEHPVLSVNNDNIQAAKKATLHLLEQGYEKVVFISGDPNLIVSQDRISGYKQALSEKGISFAAERAVTAEFSIESGFNALQELKSRGVDFDAVLAADDLFALGALQFAGHNRLRVPEELGIVGFNDSPLLSFTNPPLTSVKILSYELGMEAVKLLLNALSDPEHCSLPAEHVIPSQLIIRQSSLKKNREMDCT
ncbi:MULTISPECIES: LacI family DNA-binding transcriptional regulator [Thermoactinomyces]|jgi:DNA-binding LacI/PurR family transcriptional regulator|uniref:LacI family DNA-binding transcriptional regulator n=1 Tax=Thermoactinomyces daqus TaxID=1329516 RepID=A0A7W2AJI9_9BACL|nr:MULTISPECIES: LacI family DNA-binding transcriptional regulator [Thermoactinomyces]MBA4543928.1 LacI family DNA-binding transcriptional regulator [Thermoactinomyces daqus]MBH8597441.1 LacI family DNA-binding transcriptional regulator [Thermoactinomyces sp. CICC 10523]MBH8603002.1 LacI family DNA-binding transcriptional regulator [Thermoactinomyces sp. CICC 10522]MBH8607150.1 LacI family DNA-binding transcriptional regulator [Thermoactinomyces sp. CICC 10521]